MAVVGYLDGYVDENNREYGLTDTVAQESISAIKDGTNIDSFGDVETALADKADEFGVDNFTITWLQGIGVPNKLSVMEHDEIPQEGTESSGLPSDTAIRKAVKSAYDLMEDTVGWTGKNLLKEDAITTTQAGVTFTMNNDGSVTVNGTNSLSSANVFFVHSRTVDDLDMPVGKYIASIGDADLTNIGMSIRVVATRSSSVPTLAEIKNGEKTFTKQTGDIIGYAIVVDGNATISNITIYPMIRKATILDPTYEPYRGTTAFPRDEQRVLGAKNLCHFNFTVATPNGITWTIANGVIDADGTTETGKTTQAINSFIAPFSAQVIINGCNSGQTNVHMFPYDKTDSARPYTDSSKTTRMSSSSNVYNGNELSFYMEEGHEYAVYCRILGSTGTTTTVNHQKFYPMIRLATDTDDTYVPYVPTNKELADSKFPRDEQRVLGAKNLLPPKLLTLVSLKAFNSGGTWIDNVCTLNGVTFTCVEENGYVVRIDVDGTATGGNAQFLINNRNSGNFVIPKGSWIGNGCPSGGSDDGYHMRYIETVSGSALEHRDYGNGVAFTVESANNCGVTIYVKQNGSVSNKSFYPMCRIGTDPDPTFAQPAMTNRELTDAKLDKNSIRVSGVSVDDLTTAGIYYCAGGMTGLPFGSIGTMIVIKSPVNTYQQIYMPAGDPAKVYIRRYWESAWSPWYLYTGTVVS